MEIFKDIEGTQGDYQISNFGNVKSLRRLKKFKKGIARVFKGSINTKGYPTVCIYVNGEFKTTRIHRLVAKSFIPNPENKPEVNHIDGVKTNNNVFNLEWVTGSENVLHAYKNNLMSSETNRRCAKINKKEVVEIRDLYKNKIFKVAELSYLYELSIGGIYNITSNKVWKNI